jgi:hypothetical protein
LIRLSTRPDSRLSAGHGPKSFRRGKTGLWLALPHIVRFEDDSEAVNAVLAAVAANARRAGPGLGDAA